MNVVVAPRQIVGPRRRPDDFRAACITRTRAAAIRGVVPGHLVVHDEDVGDRSTGKSVLPVVMEVVTVQRSSSYSPPRLIWLWCMSFWLTVQYHPVCTAVLGEVRERQTLHDDLTLAVRPAIPPNPPRHRPLSVEDCSWLSDEAVTALGRDGTGQPIRARLEAERGAFRLGIHHGL